MKKIKNKILSVALGIIILALLTTTTIGGLLSYSNTMKTLDATMSELSTVAANQIQNNLDKTRAILAEIGTVARLSSPELEVSEKKALLDAKVKQHSFLKMNVADGNGVDFDGNNVSSNEFFKKAISGETYITNPTPSEDKTKTVMTVSAPLWENGKADTKIVGVVYAEINGNFLSEIASNISVGETGSAYIIDNQGYTIAHKNYELVLNKDNTVEAAKSDKQLAKLAALEKIMTEGRTGFGEYSYGGKHKLLTYAPIQNTNGWSVAINLEKNEFVSATYNSIYISIGISAVILILAVIVFILFANSITKPVKEIEAAAKEMSNGNLQIEIKHKGKDELGQLADSFNTTIIRLRGYIKDISRCCSEIADGNFDIAPEEDFKGDFVTIEQSLTQIVDSLSDTLGQINIAAEQVSSGSNQVSSGAQALAQSTTEQASSTQELSASIAEISEQIKQNAENSQNANEKVGIVESEINNSNEKMQSMITAMKDINNKSAEIGNIIKTIDNIAFQTNILALNAAVEAARAGAAGKGFAVVADEVRNLASKSAEAAKNTTKLIEDSIESIRKGTAIADETAKSLSGVVTRTMETIELIRKISKASNEQANSIYQVNQGIGQISDVVQTNSATAEESSAASEELSGQAETLKQLVSKFSLKETDSLDYPEENTNELKMAGKY